jgi:hypothetical protein
VGRYSRGLTRVSLASFVMASSFPCCEIRQLLVHIYPGGSKAGAAERITVFYGRRGRPVKKPRFMPAELAHQLPASCRPGASAPSRCSEPRGSGLWPAGRGSQAGSGFLLDQNTVAEHHRDRELRAPGHRPFARLA